MIRSVLLILFSTVLLIATGCNSEPDVVPMMPAQYKDGNADNQEAYEGTGRSAPIARERRSGR